MSTVTNASERVGTATISKDGYFSLTLEAYGYSTSGEFNSEKVELAIENALQCEVRQIGIPMERIDTIEVNAYAGSTDDHSIDAYVLFEQGVTEDEAQQVVDSIGCSLYLEIDYDVNVRDIDLQFNEIDDALAPGEAASVMTSVSNLFEGTLRELFVRPTGELTDAIAFRQNDAILRYDNSFVGRVDRDVIVSIDDIGARGFPTHLRKGGEPSGVWILPPEESEDWERSLAPWLFALAEGGR